VHGPYFAEFQHVLQIVKDVQTTGVLIILLDNLCIYIIY
jgi:hypothetical protein